MAGNEGPKKYVALNPKPANVEGVDPQYTPVDEDDAIGVGKKADLCFINAKAKFDEIFYDASFKLSTTKSFKYKKGTKKTMTGNTSEGYTPEELKDSNIVGNINNNLIELNKLISQGIINLQVINLLGVQPTSSVGGGNKKDKNRKQNGGAVPDLINNVTAFQNVGGLLATASPLDNANRMEPAIYNAGSFNAGIFMPVSSGSGLPSNYRIAMDQPLQSGGKAKKNKNKSKQ